MSREPQIVALGGNGFVDRATRALDEYALRLTGKPQPKVCLIPTACGDASPYVAEFYKSFAGRAQCSHLSLFRREETDLRTAVLEQDVLYISGGSTANLLAVWRAHGLDEIVRDAWRQGVVVVGVSAGGCALFQGGVSASFGEIGPLPDGIGLVSGAFCPHYRERREVLLHMLGNGIPIGFGADDAAALHFVGSEVAGAVGATPDARAFRVDSGGGEVEIPLEVVA